MPKNSYEENVQNWLKRKGFSSKYEHAGIYCIKIDNAIVYIGKSTNMLRRVAQHYVGIKKQDKPKYRIIAEVQRKGHSIGFDVLYYAQETNFAAITEELGAKEGEYIRQYRPCLNTQIPKESDWRKFEINKVNAKEILAELLG